MKLFIGTDQYVVLPKLTGDNGTTGTDATVTATVTDSSGRKIGGQTWPLTLNHDGAGRYSGILQDTLKLEPKQRYLLTITAELGGVKRTWRDEVTAEYDTLTK